MENSKTNVPKEATFVFTTDFDSKSLKGCASRFDGGIPFEGFPMPKAITLATCSPVEFDYKRQSVGEMTPILADNITLVTDGQFVDNKTLEKLKEAAYQLCLAIERLPAREKTEENVQQTNLSVQASDIHQELQKLVYPHLYK